MSAKTWASLLLVALCGSMAAYERFFYSAGGLSCGDYRGSGERFEERAACWVTAVSPRTLSFGHLGDENMLLLKLGSPIFGQCFWVDMQKYRVAIDGSENLARSPACGSLLIDIESKS